MTTICRHIKTNGQRCGCPALRDHAFCFFHRNLAQRHADPAPGSAPAILHPLDGSEPQVASHPNLNLPALEDRESIQLATSMIIGALARNTLDTRRAATLLYGLQVASANARDLKHQPDSGYLVTETILTPAGDEIAPDVDPQAEIDFQQFLQDLEAEDADDEDGESSQDDDPAGLHALSPARRYLARRLLRN